ncbi:MAG: TM2 domain-containing protein [Flavobacteriales bacterium]|nr:TM2 domain-containing protein [Flavobacteriales bacterium]
MMRQALLGPALLAGAIHCAASGPFQANKAFDASGLDSLSVEPAPIQEGAENARWVASGLAVLLGPFGAHRLYLGTTPKVAIIYGLTFGGFGVLVLLDLGHMLFTLDIDAYRNSDRVFMWGKPTVEGRPQATPP